MSEKLSHEAVLPISFQFYMKYAPAVQLGSGETLSTVEGREDYARKLGADFAKFHKAFHSQLTEEIESGK